MSERNELLREIRDELRNDMANEVALRTRVQAEPVFGDPTLGLGFNLDITSIIKLVIPILIPLLVPVVMPMIGNWLGVTYSDDALAFITTSLSGLITVIMTGNVTARTIRVNNERKSRLKEAEMLQAREEANKDRALQRDILNFKEAQLALDRDKFEAEQGNASGGEPGDPPTGAAPRTTAPAA